MIAAALGTLLAVATSPRERVRFDDDWRFFRAPVVEGAARLGPYSWEWKLANTGELNLERLPDDLGPGEWMPTRLGINVLKPRQNGWFRAELGADREGSEKTLVFDSTDEDASVFLNGKHIGTHVGFGTQFEIPVGDAWRPEGPNTLVVLVKNWAQSGGINGGVNLVMPESKIMPAEAARDFDDRSWRTVHLPHDYVIEGKFDASADNSHGSLPKPVGYYRKTIVPTPAMRGRNVWLDFDGVYRNADVFLNGVKLVHQDSGYAGFRVDLTDRLDFARPNVLAVRVDPRKNEGWWYEGGGIYRHVWLNVAAPLHVEPDGIFGRATIEHGKARVRLSATIANQSGKVVRGKASIQLRDPAGRVVGKLETKDLTFATGSSEVGGELTVTSPRLWDLEHPNLYRIEVELSEEGKTVDRDSASFGIRSIRWDKDRGFFLNEKPLKLQGTSNHQDHAGVGVALPDSLMEWRIKRLKEMGGNAYRTAHNPVARELLDACDRLGMLVLDETRHLGDSTSSKSAPGTTAEELADLKYQIRHDRNHPSVIAWSLYNEEPLQGSAEGAALFEKMRAVVDELDGTRLCTGATNTGFDKGIIDVTLLFGINYNIGVYDAVRAGHPDIPLFGSETGSAVSTRGIYANDAAKAYVGAYDVNKASFGNTAEEAWRAIGTRPWMSGAFVWTGFDYKGEPTPYGWPAINSAFGIIDIAGFPKDSFWYYKSWWGKEPVVHLLPHWNWAGREGQPVNVWAHSNADEVELFLNGRSQGKKTVPRLSHVEWNVPYTPGRLEAVGTRGGKVIARDMVETAGAPVGIRLRTDRKRLLADGEDVALVEVEIIDAKGRVVPTASDRVSFSVEGAGAVAGVGNGDPSDHDPDKGSTRRAFGGRCMVLVQSNGETGGITLRVSAVGLKEASLHLNASR